MTECTIKIVISVIVLRMELFGFTMHPKAENAITNSVDLELSNQGVFC